MFKCKNCHYTEEKILFVPYKNGNKKLISDPIWLFHLKSICAKCRLSHGFVKQTDELMEGLKNNFLANLNADRLRNSLENLLDMNQAIENHLKKAPPSKEQGND